MIERAVRIAAVTQPARLQRSAECSATRPLKPWLRAVVWVTLLLWCVLVWAGVYVAYVAAGGPLP
jgi:hypothetical protein